MDINHFDSDLRHSVRIVNTHVQRHQSQQTQRRLFGLTAHPRSETKHTAESYFKDVDSEAPADSKTHTVDAAPVTPAQVSPSKKRRLEEEGLLLLDQPDEKMEEDVILID
ncbi:hypothetical protein EWM64_g3436 [Hericium alpestre]|uniref:Uncharacterized protein n=1 Tax=Hericium alpestre TaxID=135208 RepID=A0A4Z0A0J0_9AGAM|nr:hypothetical protein EWM64_g3436 [Hericium alpestre]